jgi:hypothetical protein
MGHLHLTKSTHINACLLRTRTRRATRVSVKGPAMSDPPSMGQKPSTTPAKGIFVGQKTTTSCRRCRVPSRSAPSAPLWEYQGVFSPCVNRYGGCAMPILYPAGGRATQLPTHVPMPPVSCQVAARERRQVRRTATDGRSDRPSTAGPDRLAAVARPSPSVRK